MRDIRPPSSRPTPPPHPAAGRGRGRGAHRLTSALVAAALLGGCGSGRPPAVVDCDLGRGPCATETALGRIVLEFAPRPLPTMAPIAVALDAAAPLDEVALELEGRDMDMGPNRSRLAPQSAQRWTGTATLPVCLTGRMAWRATVTLRAGERETRIAFGFEAG